MVQLMVSKGQTKSLPPGGVYTVELGWDAKGDGDKVDLDAWVIRVHADGTRVPVGWANESLHRPDLGKRVEPDGTVRPWVATAEMDVVHQGDDTTGASSDGGPDEIVKLDVNKAPADVVSYEIFIHYFTEPQEASGTLGMAENIVCNVRDEASGNELTTDQGDKIKLAEQFAFAQTAHIATISVGPSGNSMTNRQNEHADSFLAIWETVALT